MINEAVKNYIKEHEQDIRKGNFDAVYKNAEDYVRVWELTHTLLKAGIDVLKHCSKVPENYMYDSNFPYKVYVPKNCKSIGNYAFADSSVESVYIQQGVQYIDEYVFLRCNNIRDLWVPYSVKIIGLNSFKDAIPDMKIHVEPGSYAETYFKERGFTVVGDYIDK